MHKKFSISVKYQSTSCTQVVLVSTDRSQKKSNTLDLFPSLFETVATIKWHAVAAIVNGEVPSALDNKKNAS